MSQNQFQNIEQLEASLWDAADNLRANSKLTSSEYCMPVLGVIFLRHATNRYDAALRQIEEDQAAGKMPRRAPIKADFLKRRALLLPREARYDELRKLPKGAPLGTALVKAMDAIERGFEPLLNQLPKDYDKFENDLLEDLLRIFDSDALRNSTGDVFGRIYEYFLMKFAMQGAQDNGEFFTPPSLVQTIVNVIEPDHGIVFDPAFGSGGMAVQSSHFIERRGEDTAHRVTFFGQEKTATTIRLAKMNLAVHGLEGDIREANTFYEDVHTLFGKCDFVMANPPFNVDKVDAEKVKDDRRLPFGLPGVNKEKKVSNGNYLWISYFHSYLGPKGRAGFVMSSQASSAGHGEAEVRRKLVETGDVDAMISIRSNFFYTRTVPCELWFFDKGRPADRRDQVLMLDARNIYRKVTRKIYDFAPEQLQNLTAIVWLYRGQSDRFVRLLADYHEASRAGLDVLSHTLCAFHAGAETDPLAAALDKLDRFLGLFDEDELPNPAHAAQLREQVAALRNLLTGLVTEGSRLHPKICDVRELMAGLPSPESDAKGCLKRVKRNLPGMETMAHELRGLLRQMDEFWKQLQAALDHAEDKLGARRSKEWKGWKVREELAHHLDCRQRAHADWHRFDYFRRQLHWLLARFPEAKLVDVPGLVKLVDRKEIAAADWSLTPGRYVGVAPAEVDEDFDFEQALGDIHVELADLNKEAAGLAKKIQKNFEELGV